MIVITTTEKFFSLTTDSPSTFWRWSGNVKKTLNGFVVQKSTSQWSHDYYPASVLKTLEIQADLLPGNTEPVIFELLPYVISIDGAHHQSHIGRTVYGNWLAHADNLQFQRDQINRLVVRYSKGTVRISLNGENFTFKSRYQPTIGNIKIHWPAGTVIKNMEVTGTRTSCDPMSPIQDYVYQMTVDFPDDIVPAPFTKEMLDRMMNNIAQLGVKRVYWIYYGGQTSGFWDLYGNNPLPDRHIKKTFASLGSDDLAAAVVAGHKHGLEVYAIIKPFDMSIMGRTFPLGSPLAEKFGKTQILGGKTYWSFDFPAKHPELCIQRRTHSPTTQRPIERVEISSLYPIGDLSEKIEVWVSQDNWKYQRYDGSLTVKTEGQKIVIQGLHISSPFLAIRVSSQGQDAKILNTADRLITLIDGKGRQIDFTYGIEPRKYAKFRTGAGHMEPAKQEGGDFRRHGFFFDYCTAGIPSGVFCGDKVGHDLISLDNPNKVLGAAIGKNHFVPGALCPSEPKARDYWLTLIRQALACGADGIDLRPQNHLNVLEWPEYGFNGPIVREFKKRYGIDIRREEFPKDKWRELRGEFYTQFLRQARQEIQNKGKRLQLHIEDMMEGTSEASCPMEIFWDWQSWLKEGLADEVTFKVLNPDNLQTHFGRTLIQQCRRNKIPLYYSPFINAWGVLGRPDWQDFLAKRIRNSGINGLVIYEHSFIYVAQLDGTLVNREKPLTEFLAELSNR
jgi:hypothetical protein